MNPELVRAPGEAVDEIAVLIAQLHEIERRLHELTAGEVDTVADRDGRPFLLKLPQELLRDIESARQAAILNALPARIALLDRQGVITSINEAWRRFGSVSAVQAPGYGIGLNYIEICEKARGERAAEARRTAAGIRSVLDGSERRFSIEYPCHLPAEERWFLMTATPLASPGPGGAVVMHTDITQHKRMQAEQRQVARLLDNIVENIPTAVQLKSVQDDFRILMWNKAAETMYGVPRESAIGRSVQDLWPEADAARMNAADLELVATGIPQDFPEREIKTRNRGARCVHMRKVVLYDDARTATHLLVIADDITTQREDQARLRESEARFRSLTELSSDWFWEQDADFRFARFAGGDHEKGWGTEQQANVGLRRWELPDVAPLSGSWDEHKAQLAARLPFRDFQYRRELGSGGVQYVTASGVPLFDPEGRFTGYRGVASDITRQKRDEEELRRFAAAMDATADAIYLVDRSTMRFVHVNEAACRMQGRTREALMALGPDGVLLTSRAELERVYDDIIASGADAKPLEMLRTRKDGSKVWVELRRHAQRSGNTWLIVTLVRDVTERKTAEARIGQLNRVHAMLSGINALIVRIRDRDELFREACRVAVEAGGFCMAWIGIVDREAVKIVPLASAGMDAALLATIVERYDSSSGALSGSSMAARSIRGKCAVVSNDLLAEPGIVHGEKYAACGARSLALLPLVVADQAAGVLALFAGEVDFFHEEELKLLTGLAGDIAFGIDHIQKDERVTYLALYDPLTGLANRALFHQRLDKYLGTSRAEGGRLAVLMLDIERFRTVNGTLGREAGDELLRQFAKRTGRDLTDPGWLARIGGDQFASVIPGMDAPEVIRRIEQRLAEVLGAPFQLGEAEVRVSMKIGIAFHPDDGSDADTLLRNAEAALKNAKSTGERYLFYAPEMTARVAENLALENRLRQAIEKGEFVLHYQPKIALAGGKLTGAEALIRWNDPRTGLVPPGRFIPILEETGLINDVGRWALRRAIEEYLRWRAAGLPAVRIAVNVSPLQLRNRGFIEEVRQAIGVDPHAADGLELEITESLLMEDVKHSIASLKAIREMGVCIAIDDFGTGFSSLSYLAKLPVDTLKIDRTFVVDMTASPQGLALVSTIIKLAHSLKLKVVAEGVETEEQSNLLRLLDCDELQGFLYSKPLPCELFEAKFLAAVRAPRPEAG